MQENKKTKKITFKGKYIYTIYIHLYNIYEIKKCINMIRLCITDKLTIQHNSGLHKNYIISIITELITR